MNFNIDDFIKKSIIFLIGKQFTISQIAKELGTSDRNIYRWLKQFNIKKSKIKKSVELHIEKSKDISGIIDLLEQCFINKYDEVSQKIDTETLKDLIFTIRVQENKINDLCREKNALLDKLSFNN